MANVAITESIGRVLELSRQMLMVAERGEQLCMSSKCGVLYGTLRDAAFKIRRLAEEAREEHGSYHLLARAGKSRNPKAEGGL